MWRTLRSLPAPGSKLGFEPASVKATRQGRTNCQGRFKIMVDSYSTLDKSQVKNIALTLS